MIRNYIIIFIIIKASGASATLTLSEKQLENYSAQVGFFDPHNHSSGVLPPLGLIDPYKYIYGQELSTAELEKFWSNIINFVKTDENFKKNADISNGTKKFLNCNEAMHFCSQLIDDKKCREKIIDGINNLFSSTLLTEFPTAYNLRHMLMNIPDLPRISADLSAQATLFSLAKNKVDLVEMSKAFLHNKIDLSDRDFFARYANLIHDLKSVKTSEENLSFKKRLHDLGLEIPRIKWLLMTHTLQLAKSSDNKTLSYADGNCQEIAMPAKLDIDPAKAIYGALLDFPDVVGVDVAGPELSCFTKRGMEEFKKLAEFTYRAAKIKRFERAHKGKLLVRVHVGEGFPLHAPAAKSEYSDSCADIKNFPEVKYIHDRVKLTPIHRLEAQKNIDYILEAIKELKEHYKDIDNYIVFRLGHLTHIDMAQALQAKRLGISADVNLNSNLATGAWPVSREVINKYLTKNNITPNNIRNLREELIKNGANIGEIFDGHGLKSLLYYKVPLTLGSDAAGVEHSTGMREEYLLAKQLIDYWNAHDDDFARKNITIDDLLLNQKYHYEEMGYSFDN
jgi:hypothetical protein